MLLLPCSSFAKFILSNKGEKSELKKANGQPPTQHYADKATTQSTQQVMKE